MQGSKATIDGIQITRTIAYKKSFATTISYSAAVNVLGKDDRSGYGHNDLLHVWDSLGFTMLRDGEHPKDGRIWNFAVTVRKDEQPRPMDPKTAYAGRLTVNGIAITWNTHLENIVPALVKQGFHTAQGPHCYCLVRKNYELVVGAHPDGLVNIVIFRDNVIDEIHKATR